jgi:hypothetical protein
LPSPSNFKRKHDFDSDEPAKRKKQENSATPVANSNVKTVTAMGSRWLQKDRDLDVVIERRRNESANGKNQRKKFDNVKSINTRKRKASDRLIFCDLDRGRFPPLEFAAPNRKNLLAQRAQKVAVVESSSAVIPIVLEVFYLYT